MEDRLFEEFNKTFEAFKAALDRHDQEIEKHGTASQEIKSLVDTLNNQVSELDKEVKAKVAEIEAAKARAEAVEAALKRVSTAENQNDPRESPAYKSFMAFIKGGKASLDAEAQKALVADSTGRILFPELIEAEIYRELPPLTIMRNLVGSRKLTKGDRIRRRSITEVAVGWGKLETGGTITESEPTPSLSEYVYVEDLYALAKIGEDELEDSEINIEAILTDSFANAIAAAEDKAFVLGVGHTGEEPEGILLGSTITRKTSATPLKITADDFLGLIYGLDPRYRKNGVFVMNSQTELAIRKMKDGNGQYLWQPAVQAGAPNLFLGYKIYNQDDIAAFDPEASQALDVAIFGDLKNGYRILDRSGMSIQRLVEAYAEEGMVGFKVHYRVGGGVIRPKAMLVLKVPIA